MNEDRIKELFSNEEFVKDLFASKSYEEAQSKLADKDVNVSVEELKKALQLIQTKQEGELNDEALEEVSGGLIGEFIAVAIAATGVGLTFKFATNACS